MTIVWWNFLLSFKVSFTLSNQACGRYARARAVAYNGEKNTEEIEEYRLKHQFLSWIVQRIFHNFPQIAWSSEMKNLASRQSSRIFPSAKLSTASTSNGEICVCWTTCKPNRADKTFDLKRVVFQCVIFWKSGPITIFQKRLEAWPYDTMTVHYNTFQ